MRKKGKQRERERERIFSRGRLRKEELEAIRYDRIITGNVLASSKSKGARNVAIMGRKNF